MDKKQKTLLVQLVLLIVTFITTTISGAEWATGRSIFILSWKESLVGLSYSIPFLGILTVHEFGHYFTAKYHKIRVSLPYYIPLWLPGMAIGTMGAFIRIRDHIGSRLKYFDVGISGPIAGFVVALFVLYYGFSNLPGEEYIYNIHPEYKEYASIDEAIQASDGIAIKLGGNLLFSFFKAYVADPSLLPPESEMMHYPWLLAGYLALFFTALNLLPIGQLDGGHVVFGLVGPRRHAIVSRVLFTLFILYASLGWVTVYDLQDFSDQSVYSFLFSLVAYIAVVYIASYSMFAERRERLLYAVVLLAVQFIINLLTGWVGYQGWLLFAILIGRFLGVDHPPVYDTRELSLGRKILGWVALIIFIICFSPQPLIIESTAMTEMP